MACGSHTVLGNLISSRASGLMGECEVGDPSVNMQVGDPGNARAGQESHLVSWAQEPQAHRVQLFLSGCSCRPAAAGHRPQGLGSPGQRGSTAAVERGHRKNPPGLRVRRPCPWVVTSPQGPGNDLLGQSLWCVFPPTSSSRMSQLFRENSFVLPRPVIDGEGEGRAPQPLCAVLTYRPRCLSDPTPLSR